jgi:2'-hydroxyisoflavone reductase
MKLLILGGTVFLGRAIVEVALDRDHEVTLFNRGKTGRDLFPNVEKLRGDRDGNLDALEGRTWDGVIDTSGYVPRLVHASSNLLKNAVSHYSFISSISVYADRQFLGIAEDAPLQTLQDPTTEEVTGETYGGLKVLCEEAAEDSMPGRSLSVRLGLLVGPHDPTGRFTYWVDRVAEGGEILVPGPFERQVQFIDVRDAAEWIVRMSEERATGAVNVTGPNERLSMGEFLTICTKALQSNARINWVDDAFLRERGVQPWSGLPLWPPSEAPGIFAIVTDKAQKTGLTCRPLAATIRDTFEWSSKLSSEGAIEGSRPKVGLTREREAELLHEWRAHPAGAPRAHLS